MHTTQTRILPAVVESSPIKLYQQLIQRHPHVLLILAVSLASNGIHLVNEYNAWGRLLGGCEQVPHSASADADEHFLEL